ncbi:HAMP domain-containing protein [Candidatus Parcubacteria bacterium]|nr:HAMP domain-containing protein [Candidatus Parcubacteria bacterium]
MRRHSLYTIVLLIYIILIIFGVGSTYFSREQHKKDLIEAAIRNKTHLAEIVNLAGIISETISLPEWVDKQDFTSGIGEIFVTEMAKSEDLRYIRVVNQDGTIYKSSVKEEEGEIIKDTFSVAKAIYTKNKVVKDEIFKGEEVKLVIYPGYENQTIWVAFTLDSVQESIQGMWTQDMFTILAILLLYFVFLLIILRSILTPLKKMTFACEQIRGGNLDVNINVKSRTEIGDLAETFNKTIGDLKISHISLKEEKNKTLAIITNFADGLLVFNKENELTLVNPKAEYFLGVKSKEITNKHISEIAKLPALKPLVDLFGEKIKKVLRKELQVQENLILEVSAIPVIRQQEMVGNMVILHNITREKIVERLKTEFVSLSAHQLRTPLSGIKWSLKMLLDGDLGKITKNQKNFIEKTYQSNERMINLINGLLNVTKIEEGRYLYKPCFVQFEKVVQSVINSLEQEIKRKKIEFVFNKPKEKMPKNKVDEEKIKLAINNLIDNAVRYTPSEGKVTISLKYDKKNIEFSIKDTGFGISENQKKRVFTKFFRGDNVMKIDTEGSGLGLFITKNIIEAHGGKIWFESEKNKGTTFYFTLPISKQGL